MNTLLKPAAATKILIVDDVPDNLRLLAKILETQGFVVYKSLNGKMALQAVHQDLPDLILLDIMMPDMNGYDVCQQLKVSNVTASIPIIFISALDRIDDKVRAFELGGQDYITKPFQEMEVVMRVKNQLLIRQQRQQLIEQNQRLKQEVANRLEAESEIRQLVLKDDLTGLYNRRGFFLLAEQQLKIARRTQTPCCLLFMDLDGLKKINDSLGHKMGDRMIAEAARLLTQTFRDADIIARLGGDEFAVLIPGCLNNSDDFRARLQANIDHFNQSCALRSISSEKGSYAIAMSVGIKQCALSEDVSLEQLLEDADKSMYFHKRTKRLNVHSPPS